MKDNDDSKYRPISYELDMTKFVTKDMTNVRPANCKKTSSFGMETYDVLDPVSLFLESNRKPIQKGVYYFAKRKDMVSDDLLKSRVPILGNRAEEPAPKVWNGVKFQLELNTLTVYEDQQLHRCFDRWRDEYGLGESESKLITYALTEMNKLDNRGVGDDFDNKLRDLVLEGVTTVDKKDLTLNNLVVLSELELEKILDVSGIKTPSKEIWKKVSSLDVGDLSSCTLGTYLQAYFIDGIPVENTTTDKRYGTEESKEDRRDLLARLIVLRVTLQEANAGKNIDNLLEGLHRGNNLQTALTDDPYVREYFEKHTCLITTYNKLKTKSQRIDLF